MSLSDTDLAAMKERAGKATEGPWFWKEDFAEPHDEGTGLALTNAANFEVVGAYNYHCCTFRVDPIITRNEDAEFIAHAREDVPALVAEVEALRAENERLENSYRNARAELANLRQALLCTVAHEAELVALLDPDNDEAVEIVARALWLDFTNRELRSRDQRVDSTDWDSLSDDAQDDWRFDALPALRALRDAANGED